MEIFSVNVGWFSRFSSGKKLSVIKLKTSYPAGVRSLWELSIRYPLRETSQRPFRNISKEMTFCDVYKTFQIHLKKDVFFVTSLRHLKNILKRCILCDVFKTSRTYLKKDVFSMTSLGHLKNISRKYLWFFKNTPQKRFRVISIRLLQYLTK